jgi:hypothetical protein
MEKDKEAGNWERDGEKKSNPAAAAATATATATESRLLSCFANQLINLQFFPPPSSRNFHKIQRTSPRLRD